MDCGALRTVAGTLGMFGKMIVVVSHSSMKSGMTLLYSPRSNDVRSKAPISIIGLEGKCKHHFDGTNFGKFNLQLVQETHELRELDPGGV